jgi:ADP-ribosyl-[dinitrogen reductase] hydrolase
MLLETGLADAYSAPFEYAPAEFVKKNNNGEAMYQHPRWQTRGSGRYTDDTQMSLAIAEMILDGVDWTKAVCADYFYRAFARDPRTGYASRFYRLLHKVKNGEELLTALIPNSDKSGGAMRAGPIGLYTTIEKVLEVSAFQASVTHDTDLGKTAAQAAALATHYCAYHLGSLVDLPDFIQSNVAGQNWDAPYQGPVGPKGWMSVRAAITSLSRCNTLKDLLIDCVAYTGDVDTVAAIALGAASFSSEIANNLPQAIIDGLENGPYGREYLIKLDKQLVLKFSPFLSI